MPPGAVGQAEMDRTASGVRPLVMVTRGSQLEAVHLGAVAVCDPSGQLVAHLGDPDLVSFLRSTAKPLQAVPFLESGAAEAVSDRDVALACASHVGTDEHVEAVADFQSRVQVAEADVRCGSHKPYDPDTVEVLIRRGEQATPNRHNCSGKHTAMLATARHMGEPLSSYLETNHPVQRRIQRAIGALSGIELTPSMIATDGCSAPNFALPLCGTATAFARLADPSSLSTERSNALGRIYRAMTNHAKYVAGEDRFDTLVMEATPGSVLAKSGAEGNLGMALRLDSGRALGIAVKIADGDLKARAKPLVAIEILDQLGALGETTKEKLTDAVGQVVTSHRGQQVGVLEAKFELAWA